MIRLCTIEDVDWIVDLAIECYDKFDVDGLKKWLHSIHGRKDMVIVRGEESAAMVYTVKPFWLDEIHCELQFICCRKTKFGAGELVELVKFIDNLRIKAGCAKFYLNSRLTDLEPLALRLGAKLAGKSYVLE